ncbi:hypothetical protein [Longispora albida]|uniref:hypothetical protein n=1 Tax=Longispora albida TaxID=203523 RepID=UPI000372AB40|nr:hypothetical protein [Longispora albida]
MRRITPLILLALALAGCAEDKPAAEQPPAGGKATAPMSSAAQQGSPGAATPGGTTATGRPKASRSPVPSATACAVKAADLLAVLKLTDVYTQAGEPAALKEAVCADKWAVARADGPTQTIRVLFVTENKKWRPVSAGSSGFCKGHVPDDVARRFPGCDDI